MKTTEAINGARKRVEVCRTVDGTWKVLRLLRGRKLIFLENANRKTGGIGTQAGPGEGNVSGGDSVS